MDRQGFAVLLVVVTLIFAGCASGGSSSVQPNTSNSNPTPNSSSIATPTTTTSSSEPGNEIGSQSVEGATNGTIEVHSINVGQSDSTLIIGPTNQTMLIDTGDYRDDGELVLDYLKDHSIDRIDYLVSSHADADHIGGNAALITYFEEQANGVGAVYDPGIAASSQTYEDYLDAVEKYNVTLYETHDGDTIPFEGVQTQIVNPPDTYLDNKQRNENSIVLQLTYGQTSFILPGDIEETGESHLSDKYGARLNSTILKAAHHGSGGSSTDPFLDAVTPTVALISSAYDSQYGHPRPETLRRLDNHNVTAYWTATHGNIVLTSDGTTVDIATQREAPTDPTSLRDGSPIEPGTDGSTTNRESIHVGASSPPEPSGNGETSEKQATPISTTKTSTTVATDGGTTTKTSASQSLTVKTVHADAEDRDSDNLDDEYITIENSGSATLDISGWTVADDSNHEYMIPTGTTIEAGETITLHTGTGNDSESDLYWGSESAIWNNDGDTITVTDQQGKQVLNKAY